MMKPMAVIQSYGEVCTHYWLFLALCRDGDMRLIPAGSDQSFYLGLTSLTTFDYINMYLSRGRVEVCVNGSYGSICNNLWDNIAASAVCMQLGFSRYGEGMNNVPSGFQVLLLP